MSSKGRRSRPRLSPEEVDHIGLEISQHNDDQRRARRQGAAVLLTALTARVPVEVCEAAGIGMGEVRVSDNPEQAAREEETAQTALLRLAAQLETWATESVCGGWSTHQVRPMREEATRIRAQWGGAV